MCGIVAFFARRHPVPESVLARSAQSLHHRGPDGRQHWLSADRIVGLGHARLSIIDLAVPRSRFSSGSIRAPVVKR